MPASSPLIKKIFTRTLTLFAFLSSSALAYYPSCQPVSQGLQHLISHMNPSLRIGVVVQSLDTGRIYFSKNANHYFEPASVQKLFTVSSALVNLKPNYRFPTRVLATGSITQGTLNGSLIFQFSGDPTLTRTDLKNLVKQVKSMGIHRIAGNVIIDNGAYNNIPYPAGWLWSDLTSNFAAPLDSIIVNRNLFTITLTPARRIGEKPTITSSMPEGAASFYNEAITSSHACPLTILGNEKNQFAIRGCVPKRVGTEHRGLPIRNMSMFAKGLMRELLAKNNIVVNGFAMSGRAPASAQVVTEHFSAPLSRIIIHLLKKSDNLYADTLLKKMGEHFSHRQGSWENGLQAMYPVLAGHAGIDINQIHLIDGAGLSRYNLMTPNDVSRLLSFIAHNQMLRSTLIPALPIAGVDGTLAYRMPNLARGKLLSAKTGSMTGVSSLAGFIKSKHHGWLSFVIMINNIPKNRFPSVVLENNIAEFLATSRNCG